MVLFSELWIEVSLLKIFSWKNWNKYYKEYELKIISNYSCKEVFQFWTNEQENHNYWSRCFRSSSGNKTFIERFQRCKDFGSWKSHWWTNQYYSIRSKCCWYGSSMVRHNFSIPQLPLNSAFFQRNKTYWIVFPK